MALISCPECGREVSEHAHSCPGCGYPISESKIDNDDKLSQELEKSEIIICPSCGFGMPRNQEYCLNCNVNMAEYAAVLKAEKDYIGQYDESSHVPQVQYSEPRKGIFEILLSKRCPRCFSENVSPVARTRTTMNLNPFRPFTIANHKITKKTDWVCNNCGKVFR